MNVSFHLLFIIDTINANQFVKDGAELEASSIDCVTRASRTARIRWHVALILIQNPSLQSKRKALLENALRYGHFLSDAGLAPLSIPEKDQRMEISYKLNAKITPHSTPDLGQRTELSHKLDAKPAPESTPDDGQEIESSCQLNSKVTTESASGQSENKELEEQSTSDQDQQVESSGERDKNDEILGSGTKTSYFTQF